MGRNKTIDILKGISIVFVIILHSIPYTVTSIYGGPFYLWQAVPIFMIIAGLNGTNFYKQRGISKLSDCYNWILVLRRLKRLLKPVIWILGIQMVLLVLIWKQSLDSNFFAQFFYEGGKGPGSYFIYITIQNIFCVPIFYWLALKRNANWMLLFAIILNVIFELATYTFNIDPNLYRIIFPRYIFAIALGVWIAIQQSNPNRVLLSVGVLISWVYIFLAEYMKVRLPILAYPEWLTHNVFNYAWSFAIVLFFLNRKQKIIRVF